MKIQLKRRQYDGKYAVYALIPLVHPYPHWVTVSVSKLKAVAWRNAQTNLENWVKTNGKQSVQV